MLALKNIQCVILLCFLSIDTKSLFWGCSNNQLADQPHVFRLAAWSWNRLHRTAPSLALCQPGRKKREQSPPIASMYGWVAKALQSSSCHSGQILSGQMCISTNNDEEKIRKNRCDWLPINITAPSKESMWQLRHWWSIISNQCKKLTTFKNAIPF